MVTGGVSTRVRGALRAHPGCPQPLWTLLWRNSRGYGAVVATHDPTRDVQQFDAYRAALRDAVAGEVSQGARRKSLRGARVTTAKTPRPRSKG